MQAAVQVALNTSYTAAKRKRLSAGGGYSYHHDMMMKRAHHVDHASNVVTMAASRIDRAAPHLTDEWEGM